MVDLDNNLNQNKMTAVEWLQIKMATSFNTRIVENINVWFEQAKEMEKQQIINARQSGIDATINGKSISNIDYYNETFKLK